MKKLKDYLLIFFTGVASALTIFLYFTRSSETDSELFDLTQEGDSLGQDIDALEDELDSLELEELTDEESVKFWDSL